MRETGTCSNLPHRLRHPDNARPASIHPHPRGESGTLKRWTAWDVCATRAMLRATNAPITIRTAPTGMTSLRSAPDRGPPCLEEERRSAVCCPPSAVRGRRFVMYRLTVLMCYLMCYQTLDVRPPVHPHSRGESGAALAPDGRIIGSSPLAWGKPRVARVVGRSLRFIPTRMGKASA